MDPGVAGAGGQEQLQVFPLRPETEQDHIPLGLLDLINPAAQDPAGELLLKAGDADRVKRHRVSSL